MTDIEVFILEEIGCKKVVCIRLKVKFYV